MIESQRTRRDAEGRQQALETCGHGRWLGRETGHNAGPVTMQVMLKHDDQRRIPPAEIVRGIPRAVLLALADSLRCRDVREANHEQAALRCEFVRSDEEMMAH